jgi:hypothetical protein
MHYQIIFYFEKRNEKNQIFELEGRPHNSQLYSICLEPVTLSRREPRPTASLPVATAGCSSIYHWQIFFILAFFSF